MANYFENKAKLIGNLGGKPEVKATANGEMVIMSIGTTGQGYRDSETNERKDGKTVWHRVVSFNPRVVNFAKHLDKGEKVSVEGAMDNRSYEKDGATQYISEVVADTLSSLSVKKAA
jgi:single-strand DNA-binding protein